MNNETGRRRRRRLPLAALGTLLAVLTPAGALGATAEIAVVDGQSVLRYVAGSGEENRVLVFADPDSDGQLAILDPGASITPGFGCTLPNANDPHTVTCADPAAPGATFTGLSISLGNLADGYTSPFTALPAVVDGGFGNDLLLGGGGPDTLLGGGGKDYLDGGGDADTLDGEAGGDVLDDRLGENVLRAGGGADLVLFPSVGSEPVDCGGGDDRLIGAAFIRSVSCEETLFFDPRAR